MPDPTLSEIMERCAACGQRVRIYTSGEGTSSYEPACEEEIERQASEIERLREYIECYGENELALYDSMVAALNEKEPDADA